MAYADFTDAKPVGTDTGPQAIDYIRENLMALRDAVVAGAMPGWDYARYTGTGSAEQPERLNFTRSGSTERVRANLTWGSSGGEDGNVTQAVWEYRTDSGSPYETIGTESISYDADGNVTGTTWT